MDLHAIIPVVRDADAAAAGHPALVALPQGVEYVRAPKVDPYSGSLDLATTPLAARTPSLTSSPSTATFSTPPMLQ